MKKSFERLNFGNQQNRMKILYLIPFVLIIIGCKPKSNNGLDYYDYSEFEFSVEEVLSKNIFNDTINSELLEAALQKKVFLQLIMLEILRNVFFKTRYILLITRISIIMAKMVLHMFGVEKTINPK
ncbi:hypothetical protein NYZ99_15550 [Maribacter litopenaei]|uniref:Lipoprotein n=1 Tax=Maribacter litopenaei TaxID=2976127 RepID=A0ABY5Y696_9FLAO|nr:hypothetical protein [Maribacter litopenaei]UWX54351.1 hypothetical protein NYZ99_15550 [Maribacter litopenaei]